MINGISRMVDDRIDTIRKEKAELDSFREALDAREAEIELREHALAGELTPLEEQKEAIVRELSEISAEVKRLRAERNQHIANFGAEMDQLHTERTSDIEAQVRQLNQEVKNLASFKEELEAKNEGLARNTTELEEKFEQDKRRLQEEKDAYVARQMAERDAELKEVGLEHARELAELKREKKFLEDEISALEHMKKIESDKLEAELSRLKTNRLVELDAEREQIQAEVEQERAKTLRDIRNHEKQQLEEIAGLKRGWDKDVRELESRKQGILDDIELLKFEYEKTKAENITKFEKTQADEIRLLDTAKAEAQAKADEEHSATVADLEKKAMSVRRRLQEERTILEREVAEAENKKARIQGEIDLLAVKFDSAKAENEASLEILKNERMNEIDSLRLDKMREMENLRQDRVTALEQSYFERLNEFDKSREEKLEVFRKAINEAERKLDSTRKQQQSVSREMELLLAEGNKIREENESLLKKGVLERQLELEKLSNEKLEEVDMLCAEKLAGAVEAEKKLQQKCNELEEELESKLKVFKDEMSALGEQKNSLESSLAVQRDELLAEIEKSKLEAMDELSKLKIQKLQETETYLAQYKDERLMQVQDEIQRRIAENYKTFDELTLLNEDFNRRTKELEGLSSTLDADKRSFFFKEKRFLEEQADYKNLLKSEMEMHRKELALLAESRDQHVSLLQEQLRTYAQELASFQEDALEAGGKSKKVLLSDIAFLEKRVEGLEKDLQSKPTDAYLVELDEKLKRVTTLEQENKKLALRAAGLEKERHNWQIAVNEISKLTEEKAMLEGRLQSLKPAS